MPDCRETRPGGQLVLEFLDLLRRAFDQHLNASVVEILYIADDLMTRRGPLREKAIAHALHFTTDENFTRDPASHLRC